MMTINTLKKSKETREIEESFLFKMDTHLDTYIILIAAEKKSFY